MQRRRAQVRMIEGVIPSVSDGTRKEGMREGWMEQISYSILLPCGYISAVLMTVRLSQ